MNQTAVLIDDEPLVMEHLKHKLESLWPELELLGTAINGRQGLALVAETQPDIVFLDIHMPGLTGLAVAEALPDSCQVVFVTAFDQYAVAAFDRAAVDYLLKPVTDARLQQTIDKLKSSSGTSQAADIQAVLQQLHQQTPQHLVWLRTGLDEVTELLSVDEVVYFKAEQKYTSVFTAYREHLIRTSIQDLEAELDPNAFWRIHRGLIVRVDQVVSARRDLRGRYTLTLRERAETLRSSQAYGHLFKHM